MAARLGFKPPGRMTQRLGGLGAMPPSSGMRALSVQSITFHCCRAFTRIRAASSFCFSGSNGWPLAAKAGTFNPARDTTFLEQASV